MYIEIYIYIYIYTCVCNHVYIYIYIYIYMYMHVHIHMYICIVYYSIIVYYTILHYIILLFGLARQIKIVGLVSFGLARPIPRRVVVEHATPNIFQETGRTAPVYNVDMPNLRFLFFFLPAHNGLDQVRQLMSS